MRKVSLRNIASHKLRLALTVLAVVLGTAFISGAFMFTNALSNTFDSAVNNAYSDVDAVVSGEEGTPGVTVDQRADIDGEDMVSRSNVTASTTVVVATGGAEDPEPIQTGGGTSSLTIWYAPEDVVGNPIEMIDGSAPTTAEEVAVNAAGAENFGVSVGDELLIVDPETRYEVTVTGMYEQELDQGASLMISVPENVYLDRYTDGTHVGQLLVSGTEGTDPQELVDYLTDTYPALNVETGEQIAEDVSELISTALDFVNYFLIAFGLVALLVGTFLIANTFSMIVAQRTKEFALLRALGASRGQITRSVILEAFIVGLIGSALGVLAGMGLVALIKAFMASQGAALPGSGLGLSTSAVVVPIILGTVVTIISAWAPARKAGQVEPVEAMRSTEASTSQPLIGRTVAGLILLAVGVLLGLGGALWEDGTTANRAWLVGGGALSLIIGFFLAGPALSLPIVPTFGRLIGAPFGAIGKLASTNSRRNPRRTSTTAFALALGIALVTVIGMLGQTMKNSVSDLLESNISADYILTGPTSGSFPTPREVPQRAAETDGVAETITYSSIPVAADGIYSSSFGPGGGVSNVIEGDPADMVATEAIEGTTDISEDGMIATESFAAEQGWSVGDVLELTAPGISPATTDVEVVGIYEDNDILNSSVISQGAVERLELPTDITQLLSVGVNGEEGVDMEQLRANLEDSVADLLVVQVMSQEDVTGMAGQSVNQMLNILYSLLALAIIIAILGIVNTLTLSVIERRQELGMLRAVGAQRRQVRIMIILESVQIAVFGAVAGVLLGLFLGWAFLEALSNTGIEDIAVPWGMVGGVLVGSLVIGVLAAIFPAQRAAKTPPLDAISD